MKRREFLRSALAGAAELVPGTGASANWDWITSIPAVEPMMPIWEAAAGGHWHIVKEWLQRDPTLINVTGEATVGRWHKRKNSALLLSCPRVLDSQAVILHPLFSEPESITD